MLKLVIPKGSLEEQTLSLLEGADLAVHRGSSRDYHGRIDDERIDRVSLLRPQEIPRVRRGRILRPGHHRPGLGGGDRGGGRAPGRPSLRQERHGAGGEGGPGSAGHGAVPAGLRSAARGAHLHRVPGAHEALLRTPAHPGEGVRVLRGHRGQGPGHRRRHRRRDRDRGDPPRARHAGGGRPDGVGGGAHRQPPVGRGPRSPRGEGRADDARPRGPGRTTTGADQAERVGRNG